MYLKRMITRIILICCIIHTSMNFVSAADEAPKEGEQVALDEMNPAVQAGGVHDGEVRVTMPEPQGLFFGRGATEEDQKYYKDLQSPGKYRFLTRLVGPFARELLTQMAKKGLYLPSLLRPSRGEEYTSAGLKMCEAATWRGVASFLSYVSYVMIKGEEWHNNADSFLYEIIFKIPAYGIHRSLYEFVGNWKQYFNRTSDAQVDDLCDKLHEHFMQDDKVENFQQLLAAIKTSFHTKDYDGQQHDLDEIKKMESIAGEYARLAKAELVEMPRDPDGIKLFSKEGWWPWIKSTLFGRREVSRDQLNAVDELLNGRSANASEEELTQILTPEMRAYFAKHFKGVVSHASETLALFIRAEMFNIIRETADEEPAAVAEE